jgi:hypothetical protein
MFTKLKPVALCLPVLVMGCMQPSQAYLQGQAAAPEERVVVTRDLHPAGPTTRTERSKGNETEPFQIELERARSGTWLLRLLRLPGGAWVVDAADGKRHALPSVGEVPAKSVSIPMENKLVWRVQLLRQYLPVIQPGIATESEPSLDLILECDR